MSGPSYWTCNGCDADYNDAEMQAALHETASGVLLICSVCGRVGDFRDGPDCFRNDGTYSVGWFLSLPDGRMVQPNRERREMREEAQGG